MDWFALIALIVTGFTACAEFGSYAFVHPVIRRLPANYHIQVEQGLLKTFGRVMPVLMTLCSVIGVSYLVYVWPLGASEQLLAALSAISFGAFDRINNYLQCSDQPSDRQMGCRASP
jgi:hypothetical protein